MKFFKVVLIAMAVLFAHGVAAQGRLGLTSILQVVSAVPGEPLELECVLTKLTIDSAGDIQAEVRFCEGQYDGHQTGANFQVIDVDDGAMITEFALDYLEITDFTDEVVAFSADMIFADSFEDGMTGELTWDFF